MATGVDVIIDDTPEAVIFVLFRSCAQGDRPAEVWKNDLRRSDLIPGAGSKSGVEKTKKDTDGEDPREGERAAFDAGVDGLHPGTDPAAGALKIPHQLRPDGCEHSKEVSYLVGVMASELGLDFKLAKRVGLLHDIGKALDHQIEGTHAKIGANTAKKFNESQEVIHPSERITRKPKPRRSTPC